MPVKKQEIEASGQDVEEAVISGLGKLGVSRDQVEVEILEEGRRGQYIVVAQQIIEQQQGIDHRVNNIGIKHKIPLLLGAGLPYRGQLLLALLLLDWWGDGPQLPARVAIISD